MVDRCVTLVESTSPSSLLCALARRRAPQRRHARPRAAGRDAARRSRATREAIREIPGLDVLDERLAGAPGVYDYDPLRLAIDVRGTGASGYELARLLREEHDVLLELAGENVMVAVFGMGEDAGAASERLRRGAARRRGRRSSDDAGGPPDERSSRRRLRGASSR